jgi:hypothetical protein
MRRQLVSALFRKESSKRTSGESKGRNKTFFTTSSGNKKTFSLMLPSEADMIDHNPSG